MKTHVIYHKADFDGLMSAAVVVEGLHHKPSIQMHGWDYGDPIPDIPKEDALYIVDLSVEGLMDHPNLTWIDHHKSAIEKYDPAIPGYRIDGVAACRLCYQFFNCKSDCLPTKAQFVERLVDEPLSVRLAGEYDVWDKRDPTAEIFQYTLQAEGSLFFRNGQWGIPPDAWVHSHLGIGRTIQSFVKAQDARIAQTRSYRITWEGLTFLVLNHSQGNSLIFAAGNTEGVDALMLWRFDGAKTRYSLYHCPGREDLDLSEIAIRYGGGGHRGACGFELPGLALPPQGV